MKKIVLDSDLGLAVPFKLTGNMTDQPDNQVAQLQVVSLDAIWSDRINCSSSYTIVQYRGCIVLQVPRLSGMLRAFITQQGNVDIAAQYRQRVNELEGRRPKTGDAHVSQATPHSILINHFNVGAYFLYP